MKAWAHKTDWAHVALLYGLLLAVTLLFPACALLGDKDQSARNFWDNMSTRQGGSPL